jgi:general secretion pathway protein A
MYKDFFGIKASPFSIAPDPHFLYMSGGHREALAHLRYGLGEGGGFVLLTGEVGTGKTTVCRCILEQIPEDTNVAFVLNPKLSVLELLATICDELHIDYPQESGLKILIDRLNAYLLAAHSRGQRTVLIIDEAQNLSHEVLEQIRLLTNLETNQQRLLQIILLGQPELQEMLAQPQLRQLSQRIAARHHLGPLIRAETTAYIRHRLAVAGLEQMVFAPAALKEVFRLSKGTPRMINLICDRALLGAFGKGVRRVDRPLIVGAARQVFGPKVSSRHAQVPAWMIFGLMSAVALLLAVVLKWPELLRWGQR